ncbi:MAG: stage II sporulation protein M [Planctomycetota bacterium]
MSNSHVRWIPREGRLWLAVTVFTAAAFAGGYHWGKSGESWGSRLTPKVAMPHRTTSAWEAPPSDNFGIIFRNNAFLYVSLTLGLVTAGLFTLAIYGWGVAGLGFFLGICAREQVPPRLVFAMAAPHGFLEVLSFAFVGVIGLRVLWIGFEYLKSGRVILLKGEYAAWAIRILIGFVLMSMSAAVEAFVTPDVIRSEIRQMLGR